MEETILVLSLIVGVGAFLSAAFVCIFYSKKILVILRFKYPKVYEDIDRPRLFSRNSVAKYKYARFFSDRKYLELNDQELNNAYRSYKFFKGISLIGFGIFFICFCLIVTEY